VTDSNGATWEDLLPAENSPLAKVPWSLGASSLGWRIALGQGVPLIDALVSYLDSNTISEDNNMLFYLAGAILAALYLGRLPAFRSCLVALILLSLGHVHSGFIITSGPPQYLISFFFFVFITDQIALRADRARLETWRARQKGQVLQYLSEFSHRCSLASHPNEVAQLIVSALQENLDLPCRIQDHPHPSELALKGNRQTYAWIVPPSDKLEPLQLGLIREFIVEAEFALRRIEQAELETRNFVLEATQQLQSTLIDSLSHDLQTPLASILGVFEALQSQDVHFSPEQSQQLVSLGQGQTERLLRLVRNLLNEGRLQGGALQLSWQTLDVQDLVRAVLRGLAKPEAQRIQLSSSSEALDILGDAGLLGQLLANLIDNGLKFSPADQPLQIDIQAHPGQVEIHILDHGCGVREEDREKIFERFYRGTTPTKIPGSGLGLHIAKAVAELHKGEIAHFPRHPQGSQFILKLPRTE
jgi:K+-sensing histidine kinase KdpD